MGEQVTGQQELLLLTDEYQLACKYILSILNTPRWAPVVPHIENKLSDKSGDNWQEMDLNLLEEQRRTRMHLCYSRHAINTSVEKE